MRLTLALAVALLLGLLPTAHGWWFARPAVVRAPAEGYAAWYLGADTTIAPFVIEMKHGKSFEHYLQRHPQMSLVLYRDGWINKKLIEVPISAADLKVNGGVIKGNFDPSLSATEFLVETNPRQAFGSWMEKYINDDDDYRLKLVVKRGGLFGPKTLARSKKFRIFRVGPIDRVPRDQRFVLDMLQPEASVKVDADEQNYLKVTLQRNMAVRFGSRDTIHVKIVHAENAYPTRAYETVHGSNKASPSSSSSHIDLTLPIFGLQPGKYFIEVSTRMGFLHAWRRRLIFRSHPFSIIGSAKPMVNKAAEAEALEAYEKAEKIISEKHVTDEDIHADATAADALAVAPAAYDLHKEEEAPATKTDTAKEAAAATNMGEFSGNGNAGWERFP